MSKTKISEFSTTPGNNTDINGINIAEGCAPSGINNAIRELMSDLKEWQSGAMDVYVIPQGTVAAPGIQLYGDLDTGLYGFAANQLGVAVGGASAGYFSSVGWVGNVNGTITGDINATTIDTTNLEVTNIKAKDGTAAMSIADSTGVVSVSSQLAVDNLNLSGNTLSSSDTNGNIILAPNGTGDVYLDADTIRVGDSNTNVTITSNGTADLILNTNSGTNSGSITIQDGVNGNILIATNGTGQIQLTGDLDVANIETGAIKARDGTASATIANSTGVMTIASSVLTTTDINGGTIDNTVIGGATTAAGSFTTLTATQLDVDNLRFNDNTISATNTNGNIELSTPGTGDIYLNADTVRIGDANVDVTLTTNGTADLILNTNSGSLSGSITIQDGVNSNILISPNGTGQVQLSGALDVANIEVTNIKAKDGTASITLADSTGQATFSANPLLNAGTANGVPYLNASKVLTTGSALTFDGTNLGVGTANAIAKLTVDGGAHIRNYTAPNTSYQSLVLGITGGEAFIQPYTTGLAQIPLNIEGTAVKFNVSGSEVMRLTSTGLGIGTSSPAYKLDVTGSANITSFLRVGATPATGGDIRLPNTGIIAGRNAANSSNRVMLQLDSSDSVLLQEGSVTINSSGNLGLGVTATNYGANTTSLSVGNGTGSGYIDVYQAGLRRGYVYGSASTFNVSTTTDIALVLETVGVERARITSGGDFLVGTTTSQDPLTVNGGATLNGGLDFSTTGTKNWQVVGNATDFYIGDQTLTRYAQLQGITTFTAWTFVSDRRLKHEIKDLSYGLNALMQIKPREFNFIKDNQFSIGFIAQELKEVIPEAVTGNEIEFDDNDSPEERASKTLGVSKEMLIPVLVKAIQEQQAMIKQLEAKVAALEGV